MEVHIHQGGTTVTYCGQDVAATDVSWDRAEWSNCFSCIREFFPAQSGVTR